MLQLRLTGKSLVVCTAVIVAVLLAAETSALSGAFVESAALVIHRCTLSHGATVETYRKRC